MECKAAVGQNLYGGCTALQRAGEDIRGDQETVKSVWNLWVVFQGAGTAREEVCKKIFQRADPSAFVTSDRRSKPPISTSFEQ